MTPIPDETQVGRLVGITKSATGVGRSIKLAKKATLRLRPNPLGTLAAGAAIALQRAKAVQPPFHDRESCAECGAKIPPGKAGRKCQDCRRAEG